MTFGYNKTRKQNYEQNVVLDWTMRNVSIEIDIKNGDTIIVYVIYNHKQVAGFEIKQKWLWNTTAYYCTIRELEGFLIDFAYHNNSRKVVKEYIKDFELKGLNIDKTHPCYDTVVCEYIEGKFREFIKCKIELFLKFRKN